MVRELVGDVPLSDPRIAAWADAQRDRATKPWHYVNIPFGAPPARGRTEGAPPRADGARRAAPPGDCSQGCIAEALRAQTALLAHGGSAMARADALRWVVHLAADVHQPLHTADGLDRGGNDTLVRLGRRRQPVNLHAVWDREVLRPLLGEAAEELRGGRRRGDGPPDGATLARAREVARLLSATIPPAEAARLAAGLEPEGWVAEGHATARAIYAELGLRPGSGPRPIPALPGDYLEAQRPRVTAALQRAGVRLAALLDRAARERARAAPRGTRSPG